MVGDTARQVRDLLRARGLTVYKITERRSAGRGSAGGRRPFGRRHAAQVVSFVRELSLLLGVGTPLLDAIDTIARQHAGSFRASLLALRDRVSAGVGLADAMREQPALFDELAVSMVEVGESSGTLEAVLDQLAGFRERGLALKNRVATALAYPAIVLVMAAGVSVMLMTVVVPNLLSALTEAGRPLPWSTRVVKGASDALVNDWWLILLVAAAAVAAAAAYVRTAGGRRRWHRAQLAVPVVGELIRKQAIARLTVVIATLLRSGVVFVRAVEIAQRSTRNVLLRDALRECGSAVTGGRDIGAALAATGAFPPLVIQVFAVGQQSGRLEEMLERLAADYDRQVNTAAQRMSVLLEPLLILVMVAVVGLIAFATVLPMLEAADVF
jgi:type II secretory pathway component PulF